MRSAFIALVLLGGAGLGAFMAHASHFEERKILGQRQALEKRRAAWEGMKRDLWEEIRGFQGQAGVLVEDLRTGWKAGYRHAQPFRAASVVKIAIMASCFEAAEEGRIALQEVVTLRGRDKVAGSGELKGLPNGTTRTVEELISLMIVQSDNTAANLLIDRLGLDALNDSFRRMGLRATRLSRKMMDFASRRRGIENVTTAEDMALVLRKLYRGELVSPEVSERCLALLKRQVIRDRIPALLPAGVEAANKTGLERGVCHDSGIVFTPAGDFLICVLTENGSVSRPAKRFIARLALRTYRYIEAQGASGGVG